MQNFWFVMGMKNGSQLGLCHCHFPRVVRRFPDFVYHISQSLGWNISKGGISNRSLITSSEVMIQSRMRWLHMPKSLNFLLAVSEGRQFSPGEQLHLQLHRQS